MNEPNPLLEFIRAKIAEAEQALKFREQSERVWREGDDASWRAVGCKKSKAERIQCAEMESRIAVKCRHQVEMFNAVEAALKELAEARRKLVLLEAQTQTLIGINGELEQERNQLREALAHYKNNPPPHPA